LVHNGGSQQAANPAVAVNKRMNFLKREVGGSGFNGNWFF